VSFAENSGAALEKNQLQLPAACGGGRGVRKDLARAHRDWTKVEWNRPTFPFALRVEE
jgi:hypothetical protein